MSKCAELHLRQSWLASGLSPIQQATPLKYREVDFSFWAMFGSWSCCEDCGSYWFNDQFFKERVYQDQATATTPDFLAAYRRRVPDDPMVHGQAPLGVSSRWWYMAGMYRPVSFCERCTRPPPGLSAGALASKKLRETGARIWTGRKKPTKPVTVEPPAKRVLIPVDRTSQLYRIPRIRESGDARAWSEECITWPRYRYGHYAFDNAGGESLLALGTEDARALQIVVLRTSKQVEKFSAHGPTHHQNWKKVGLSRAYFKPDLVQESSMPSDKSKAAFRFLMTHNRFYEALQKQQACRLASHASLNVVVSDDPARGYQGVCRQGSCGGIPGPNLSMQL